jgi:threonine dehydrogenase-like Zn-dependent dehydrogenase
VFGQGPVGLAATQFGAAMGARVIAIDMTKERLAFAKELGADETIDPSADDPVEALKELTHGEGVSLAVDCSGAEAARSAAIKATRTWGTVCMVGEGGNVTIDVSPDLLRKQLTVVGSWTFSSVIQEECARFVADRKIEVDRLFTHSFTLDEADAAYKLFDTQTTGKSVLMI